MKKCVLPTLFDPIRIGDVDAVGFGKLYIANSDVPRPLREGAPLNEPRAELFYTYGESGYADYPALA